jgi:two-component system CheB/CheR fusion protein
MARFLEQLGCRVHLATNVAEGRDLLLKPALLINDIGLPDGSGTDLLPHVNNHGLKAIKLSGYGMDEDIARSMKAGFSAHLTKPINLHALAETIARLTQADGITPDP